MINAAVSELNDYLKSGFIDIWYIHDNNRLEISATDAAAE